VSLVVVGGLIVALSLNSRGSKDDEGGGSGETTSAATHAAGYRGPEKSRTIETTECTEPQESYSDPDKVEMPNFQYKNVDSVLACIEAAGWNHTKTLENENTWGDGTVLEQSPAADSDFDANDPPTIELKVSTGNPS
jgi:eukaryotic-like serine/threonine-protein kinase